MGLAFFMVSDMKIYSLGRGRKKAVNEFTVR